MQQTHHKTILSLAINILITWNMEAAWQVSIMKNISLYLNWKGTIIFCCVIWYLINSFFYCILSKVCKTTRRQIPSFHPHLLKSISELYISDLLCILKLEEAITTVPGHVNQDVGPFIRQEPLWPENHIKDVARSSNEGSCRYLGVVGGNLPVRRRTKLSTVTSYPR